MLYAHTDVTLGALSHWLRYCYTEVIEEYRIAENIAFNLPHWDGSSVHKEYVKDLSFGLRYLVVSFIICGIGIGAIAIAWKSMKSNIPVFFELVLIIEIFLVLVGFISPLWAWRKRIKQA